MIKVKTGYGVISGVPDGNATWFKGIPYAAPPVGDLRFRPPRDPEPWEGVRDGSRFGAPALQLFKMDHVPQAQWLDISSEDCLYLNVRTPAPLVEEDGEQTVDGRAGLPVYIFLHGGAYESGGSNMPRYAGQSFSEKGIVYVNLNYRMGLLGMFSMQALEEESGVTGCYEVLDAAKAVRWVHENIRAFGGDPDNVTLGGESAGAFTVSILMQMKEMKGMFQRCILESGTIRAAATGSRFGSGNPEKVRQECAEILEELGLEDTAEGLAALRRMPAKDLMFRWFFRPDGTPRDYRSNPTLKGLLFEEDLLPNPRKQYINDVDLLFGFNTDEGTMFVSKDVTERDYHAFLKEHFPFNHAEILERYPVDAAHSAWQRKADIFGIQKFTSSMIPYAETLADRGRHVYGYHFSYMTPWIRETGLGCSHILELFFVFKDRLDLIGADDEEGWNMADYMNRAWSGFIIAGDPNLLFSAGEPKWEPYDTRHRLTLRLGNEIQTERLRREEELDFFEEIVNQGKQQ